MCDVQPGVVDDVYLTAIMEEWFRGTGPQSSTVIPHALFRYIGTENGVFRVFPGVQLRKVYDPRGRDW